MEGLIELVAASFARHGIECPADLQLAQSMSAQPKPTQAACSVEPPFTTALPEHNYRKSLQGSVTNDPGP